jgi:flavin-dependent dehydrogenase
MLPMGTCHMNRSGNRFLLLGDAGFLVDPFSGEGIGNAMASGEIAAAILEQCFKFNDFSAEALNAFDLRIKKRFSQEFRTMSVMQYLAGSPGLFNLVVDKARKNKEISDLLTAMFTSDNIRKKLTRPGFYARLLFR